MSGPSISDSLALLKTQLCFRPPIPTSSFADQTVIVTGGNAGLGREAAKQIVKLGAAKVILAVRTLSKGEDAKQYIESETSRTGVVEVWKLDMASFASVKDFAEKAGELPRLDAVIANAGIWPNKHEELEGHEATITVNVLSTFLLAHLLLPRLRSCAAQLGTTTRLTIVDSGLHKFATLKARKQKGEGIFKALDAQALLKPADFDARYQDTKLLVMLYGQSLAEVMKKSGTNKAGGDVSLTFVNPGYCQSALRPPEGFGQKMAEKVLARSTEEGGSALVDAVALDKVHGRHGQYIDEMRVLASASWLKSEDGKATAQRVWTEMNSILEAIEPGVTASNL